MGDVIRIAIAVVERDGQFLVGKRPPGIPLAGFWEFPGGKIELDESPQAAAVRECREETGLDVDVTHVYPDHIEVYKHDTVHLHFFNCRPRPYGCEELAESPFRWVSRQELAELEFPSGNRKLIQLLLKERRSDQNCDSQ